MADPDVCAPIDANGNLVDDEIRTFEYDAKNRTVAVELDSSRYEHSYDGQDRIVGRVKRLNGNLVAQSSLVGCASGGPSCEERNTILSTTRTFLRHGERIASNDYFFSKDHLGTLHEVISSGSLVQRSNYDPWGASQVVAGSKVTDVGFAGHREAEFSTLISQYRLLDSSLGRWLSEDPLDLRDGSSRYSYVSNRPQVLVDPLGLVALDFNFSWHFTSSIEAVCNERDVAGGCWPNPSWIPKCECEDAGPPCAPSSQFRARAKATVGGDIYIYSGNFSLRNRDRNLAPRDRSVVDKDTAIYHELMHVNAGTSAGLGPLAAVEARTFSSKEECQGACNVARVEAIQRFWAALNKTIGW